MIYLTVFRNFGNFVFSYFTPSIVTMIDAGLGVDCCKVNEVVEPSPENLWDGKVLNFGESPK